MLRRFYYISYDSGFLSIHCHEIIANMIRLGIKVDLFMPDNVKLSFELYGACVTHRIPVYFKTTLLISFFYQVLLIFRLLLTIKRDGRPEMIYTRQNYLGILPIFFARMFGIPYFAEVNGMTKRGESRNADIKLFLKAFLEQTCLKTANKVIVPSNTLRQRLIKGYRMRPTKIEVVPNGANEELFHPREDIGGLRRSLGLRDRDFVVGFVGSMGEWQGIEILKECIRVIAAQPGNETIKFLIVGDYVSDASLSKMKAGLGEGRKDMEGFMAANGLEGKVVYKGYVPYEESAEYMNVCDVLVAPYIKSSIESGGGSPIKLFAYLACEKPVIISDLGEFTDSDMLKKAGVAVMIPPDDSKALTNATIELKKNGKLVTELGKKGRDFVLKERTWLHSASRILAAYDKKYGKNH